MPEENDLPDPQQPPEQPKVGDGVASDDPEFLPTQPWAGPEDTPTIPASRTPGSPPPRPRRGGWQAPTPEELQSSFPQYDIVGVLGRGGMGAVYKGWQKNLDRFVAIKILPPEIEDGAANFAERFKREAKAMARFSHPNIVAVYDAGESPAGLLYFVMEYIEGTDVQKMVAAEGKLTPEHALGITAHVCDALAYAHKRGVIHRDIKPSNVMVDAEGQVKVADFGLAKMASDDSAALVTGSHISMGTPDFMAPEALLGMGQVDHRADLYAVGVMLYQMLTGEVPRGLFEMPSLHTPGLDSRFDAIVARAMQKNPEKRYASATELRTDLDRILTQPIPHASVVAQPPPPPAAPQPVLVGAAPPTQATPPPESRLPVYVAIVLALGAIYVLVPKLQLGHAPGLGSSASPTPHGEAGASPAEALPSQSLATRDQKVGDDSASPSSASPIAATKEAPYVNTLGMKFVPVPILGGPTGGQRILFSVWDTRVQDYEAFVKETKREWPKPDFPQGPTHPAVNLSWDDAKAFCQWLTQREQAANRLPAGFSYRLPSDHEWSCAVGIGEREDATMLPREKDGKITDAFPWGTQWPPPKGAGNYGSSLSVDEFENTSPAGSFAANRFGLYDMGGNVWQWCEDWFDKDQKDRVERGASSNAYGRYYLLSSNRFPQVPGTRGKRSGFRCVLASASSPPPAVAAQVPAVSSTPATATTEAPFVNTLGMKFVPVPILGGPTGGQRVLFSVWDTRVQDYEAFATETKRGWPKPGFEQGPTHPAVMVSWEDAQAFCAWLTERERKTGKVGANEVYRSPSDHEWSCAVGIGEREDAAKLPIEKAAKIDDAFPWGTQWPPPEKAGNYASEELQPLLAAGKYPALKAVLPGYHDGFAETSPVGTFAANLFGSVLI